jgi:hypothetical protein
LIEWLASLIKAFRLSRPGDVVHEAALQYLRGLLPRGRPPTELPAAMDELHARYCEPPSRLLHARLPPAGHSLQISSDSGSRAGVVIAAHESRGPGAQPRDKRHARQIKAARRDMSVLPVDQPSTTPVIEKVAGSRIPVGQDKRTRPRNLCGGQRRPVRHRGHDCRQAITELADPLRVLVSETLAAKNGQFFDVAHRLCEAPQRSPHSPPPIPARRRRAFVALHDQARHALTGHIGQTDGLQLRDRTPSSCQVLQRGTLTRKRARDSLKLDHHRFAGIAQNPEQDFVLGSLRRLALDRDAQTTAQSNLTAHQQNDLRLWTRAQSPRWGAGQRDGRDGWKSLLPSRARRHVGQCSVPPKWGHVTEPASHTGSTTARSSEPPSALGAGRAGVSVVQRRLRRSMHRRRPASGRQRFASTAFLDARGDNCRVSVFDAEADLTLADQVLGDLAPRGGMYVARRKEDGDQETMVIQTGEEGRHRLRLPDMSSPTSIERFIAEAQTHLEQVFGQPLPGCLAHEHALRGVVEGGQVWWVCPDGGWRCQLGDYDDLNWPPTPDERPGDVVKALVKRFARRDIAGWQSASPSREMAPWAVRISVWPMDESVIEQMRCAADPIVLDVERGSPPPARDDDHLTRENVQRGIDRAHERDVRWARWAVGCWAGFPVAQRPRPLVFVGPRAWVDGGFHSESAQLGLLHGLIESALPLPGHIVAALGALAPIKTTPPRDAVPIVVTAARKREALFRTDRGPRTIPAWQLEADGLDGSVWVADPEPNPIWEPQRPPRIPPPFPGSPHRLTGAVLAGDQRTLTVSFVGAPANRKSYCGGQIIESDTALAIVPFAAGIGRLARWQTAVGMQREVTVLLDRPLGRRVLVDLDSTPAEVLSDG